MTKSKDDIIKQIIKTAEKAGVSSFVLGFSDKSVITTHLEKVPANLLSRMVIQLFNIMCEHESGIGDAPAGYKASMVVLKKKFGELIREHNREVAKLKIIKS